MRYRHLSQEERDIISLGEMLEKSSREIAWILCRHHSSVCRELKRNKHSLGYSKYIAQDYYWRRRLRGGPRRKIQGEFKCHIVRQLERQWSPEQIVGRMKREGRAGVSIETIYRFIYRDRQRGGFLWKNLRRCRPKRKRRFPRYTWRHNRPGIDQRPESTNKRKRLGDFERDLIEGADHQGALLTIVDRKSRLTRIAHLQNKWAQSIHEATLRTLRGLRVRSLTNDNGPEFCAFKKTTTALKVPVFFTRPYASWERGTVENTNGLIRQYFPKKTSLKEISNEQIRRVERLLNNRPRKILGFLTPAEVHFKKTR
jgi:IS30 family transposase